MKVRGTLKKNSDFRRLYNRGKSAVTPHMVLYCRRSGSSVNRFGFTVSTKLGHAVVRNRVRRRLREVVRLNSGSVKTGYDIVIVARTRCINAKFSHIEQDYLAACGKLGLMRDEG